MLSRCTLSLPVEKDHTKIGAEREREKIGAVGRERETAEEGYREKKEKGALLLFYVARIHATIGARGQQCRSHSCSNNHRENIEKNMDHGRNNK